MPPSLLDQPTIYGARAKIGVIVPLTNTANEAEWNRMVPDGVSIHAARLPLHLDTVSSAGRAALYRDIERAAGDLAQAGVDVIVYGCTAGSMMTPLTALADFIVAQTGIAALTTAEAIVLALKALQIKRLALATPYHLALNEHEIRFLGGYDISVVSHNGLGYGANGPEEYRNIARIQPAAVAELVRQVDDASAEAILISCTDLATLAVIHELENTLKKPVISSNTATFWAALAKAGIRENLTGYGVLLESIGFG